MANLVAPYTGAWIEIFSQYLNKYAGQVAPYTGAWIEINSGAATPGVPTVAPYTGAWIEIMRGTPFPRPRFRSLPTRERGLKLKSASRAALVKRRSLHGSVD